MKMSRLIVPAVCLFTLTAASAHAQFYKLHNADIGGGAIGQFTTPLTSTYTGTTQTTTDSFGGEFTLRDHPLPWAGVEFNYAFSDFTEGFSGVNRFGDRFSARPHTAMHEATAAYLFHPHFRKLQPFVAIGGGSIDFVPSVSGQNQWRGTGLVELGFDIPTSNPHFGFRAQGRTLIYRDPNFYAAGLGSKTWVATNEPSLGVWMRF